METDLKDRLVLILHEENVKVNEPMKNHTTFKIGGPADFFITPSDEEQLKKSIKCIKETGLSYYVIGNGSNLLVSDEGYRGVIIQLYDRFNNMEFQEKTCTVQSGCLLSRLGMQAAKNGLSGLEFATGIPGTIGGAVVMNAGAYGGEIKDCIVSARLMDRDGNIKNYSRDELALGYRKSIASEKNLIVLSAVFELESMDKQKIMDRINQLAAARRMKQPLEYPSAGSTFKRPDGYFAGKLIEEAGLKGYSIGGACVSDKHSGFIINNGNATAGDVMELVAHVKQKVYEKSGVMLELEVKKLGNFI